MTLSNIEVSEHHLPEAEEWLEQVLDENPEDLGALNDLGYLWADQNKHLELALVMVRQALASDPKNMAYLDSLGWTLFRLARYSEAVIELQAATGGEKADAVIYEHLGEALDKNGDAPGAIAAFEHALAGFQPETDADKIKALREKLDQLRSKAAAKPPAEKPAADKAP